MLKCTFRRTIIVVVLAFCLCLPLASVVDAGNQEHAGLRILYAGVLDTDRAKDFVAFLDEHFERVETTDYLKFTSDKSDGFDVTILDYDGVDLRVRGPNISRSYSHALITLGVPGAHTCSRLGLKTAYL